VPVSGAIAYNGNPIAGASVAFYVEGSPRAATGITDEKGEFKLSTFSVNDGCVPGEATITVSKTPEPDKSTADSKQALDPLATAKMFEERSKNKSKVVPLIPVKYSDQRLTPLKETVKPAGKENRFVIQLKD